MCARVQCLDTIQKAPVVGGGPNSAQMSLWGLALDLLCTAGFLKLAWGEAREWRAHDSCMGFVDVLCVLGPVVAASWVALGRWEALVGWGQSSPFLGHAQVPTLLLGTYACIMAREMRRVWQWGDMTRIPWDLRVVGFLVIVVSIWKLYVVLGCATFIVRGAGSMVMHVVLGSSEDTTDAWPEVAVIRCLYMCSFLAAEALAAPRLWSHHGQTWFALARRCMLTFLVVTLHEVSPKVLAFVLSLLAPWAALGAVVIKSGVHSIVILVQCVAFAFGSRGRVGLLKRCSGNTFDWIPDQVWVNFGRESMGLQVLWEAMGPLVLDSSRGSIHRLERWAAEAGIRDLYSIGIFRALLSRTDSLEVLLEQVQQVPQEHQGHQGHQGHQPSPCATNSRLRESLLWAEPTTVRNLLLDAVVAGAHERVACMVPHVPVRSLCWVLRTVSKRWCMQAMEREETVSMDTWAQAGPEKRDVMLQTSAMGWPCRFVLDNNITRCLHQLFVATERPSWPLDQVPRYVRWLHSWLRRHARWHVRRKQWVQMVHAQRRKLGSGRTTGPAQRHPKASGTNVVCPHRPSWLQASCCLPHISLPQPASQ